MVTATQNEYATLLAGYRAAGLQIIPLRADGSKAPTGECKYLQDPANQAPLSEFMGRGVGIMCGRASGGIEVIDFDTPGLYPAWAEAVEEQAPGLLQRLPQVHTPRRDDNGLPGVHCPYRCETVGGAAALAEEWVINAKGKPVTHATIETRGEGNYFIPPGGPDAVHPTGRPYVLVAGDLHDIPTITPEERLVLFSCAQALTKVDKAKQAVTGYADRKPSSNGTSAATGDRPGDMFAAATSWGDVLPTGWEQVGPSYWRRPGKTAGHSASICYSSAGEELLRVHSPNADLLQPDTTYNKFSAYAALNHDGDFSAAAKDLAGQGFGRPSNGQSSRFAKKSSTQPPGTRGKQGCVDVEDGRVSENDTASDARPKREILSFLPFPTAALPEPIRGFVASGAKAIGCDESYLALPLLTVLAAAIGNSRRLWVKRGWSAPAILWTAIVGESGTSKTPAFKQVMRPTRKRQQKALKEHAEEMKRHESDLMLFDKNLQSWKRDRNTEALPPEKPEAPPVERCIVSDTTVEALAPILLTNPRGVLLARDELAGWLGSFDRYAKGGGGADASHWLSMHSAESIAVDRKTGVQRLIYVPQASVCICGGIQPGILNKALGSEHRESGLAARLLLSCPPRKTKRWTEADISKRSEDELAELIDNLYRLQPTNDEDGDPRPVLLRMTREAKSLWTEYYNQHAAEQVDLSGDLSAAWSKLEEYVVRLALIVHCVRWVNGDLTEDAIDATSMKSGIALVDWFKNETRRVYDLLSESDEDTELRQLVEWIGKRPNKSATVRDVQRGCWTLREGGEAEAAMKKLADAGYGEWGLRETQKKGGRPTRFLRLSTVSTSTQPRKTRELGGCVEEDSENSPKGVAADSEIHADPCPHCAGRLAIEPTHDGYLNRFCLDCGEVMPCARKGN